MRRLTPLTLALVLAASAVSARPLDVHVPRHRSGPHARVASFLVRHGLLTPEQAVCAAIVPAPHGSPRVEHLSIYQRSGGRCPGVPQPPVYLFDVYVDLVSGVVDTTNGLVDEVDTVL